MISIKLVASIQSYGDMKIIIIKYRIKIVEYSVILYNEKKNLPLTWRSCVATPAIWCSCGPPCSAGKTALSMARPMLRSSTLQKIMPARGPASDLCVVVVTTSASKNGESASPCERNNNQLKNIIKLVKY